MEVALATMAADLMVPNWREGENVSVKGDTSTGNGNAYLAL
jgi:hypothetical protein